MPISPKLFKKYDIRGKAEGADALLTPDAARAIGAAFGTWLDARRKRRVVVGRDNRRSSQALAAALIDGLLTSGRSVIDIGMVSTPLVYFHAIRNHYAAGVMVTGSHLPPDQNGFKLWYQRANVWGDHVQALYHLIERGDLYTAPAAGMKLRYTPDPIGYYVELAAKYVTSGRPLRVVVDAGSGTGGLIAPLILAKWGHAVECLYCEPDGSYPHHPPDPSVPANLRALSAKVRETGADIGLAFDGDADRVGVVDERGNMVAADRVLALLAQDALTRHPGAPVVGDVLCSQVLFDAIKAAGGVPVVWASGHSLVKAKMAKLKAPLGGEMSGHIFMGDGYYGFDDAFIVAGRLLALLGASGKRMAQLDDTLPRLYSTPEYRPRCPDEWKQPVIDGVKSALEGKQSPLGKGKVVSVDGVRVQYARGWGLLRASNTEPVLSLRFEGQTEADALAIKALFADALAAYPQVAALED
jgi:phosphomannomutase/phosphoglucomutase